MGLNLVQKFWYIVVPADIDSCVVKFDLPGQISSKLFMREGGTLMYSTIIL